MDKNSCECCLSNNISIFDRRSTYIHCICNDCRFEFFANEGPATGSRLYENDGDYADDLSISGNYRDLLQWQHLIALKHVIKCNKEDPVILDVGCFNGFFVKKLCDLGYDAYGIDFNKKAIEYGTARYCLEKRIAAKDINELLHENKTFDVITLFDVIEHVENPRELLLCLKGLLREGGVLILSTPNNNMLWRPALDYPPHHLSRYYPETIAGFLVNVGFKIVNQIEQMNVFSLVRNYIGSFCRDKDDKSLRGGRLRSGRAVNVARTALNRMRRACYLSLYPLDRLMHRMGFRYVGQVVICEKAR